VRLLVSASLNPAALFFITVKDALFDIVVPPLGLSGNV
jgi:hypothetical protein